MNDPGQYVCHYTKNVLLFHTGIQGMATLASLCRFAQEAAEHHAALLGVGVNHLAEQGLAWVLREQTMEVRRFPTLGETITVRTWPRHAERILCHRDTRIMDQDGQTIALGSSVWFGFDLQSRRPRKSGSFFNLDGAELPQPVFTGALPELEQPAGRPWTRTRVVQASEIDALGHMNNLRYIDWMVDHLAQAGIDPQNLRGMRVRHVREVSAGQEVEVRHATENGRDIRLDMQRTQDAQEVCLARIWLCDGL